MKILIVDDDQNKLVQLREFVSTLYPDAEIVSAYSYNSGLKLILSKSWHAILLDMQLPTFDKSPTEGGGRQRALAGQHILRRMAKENLPAPVIIVTQFERFGESSEAMSLVELTKLLQQSELPNYVTTVYYNANISNWRYELKKALAIIDRL